MIGYSAAISACEKGKQWQLALSFLDELRRAHLQDRGWYFLLKRVSCQLMCTS